MNDIMNIILLFTAIVIVGGLVLIILMITKKSEKTLDVARYRSRWLAVEQKLNRNDKASYQLAVLDADKLLDRALREKGVNGATMGERMKSYQTRWSDANAVWTAHKLRNQIAHESDFSPSYENARRALAAFKRGLKDIGAI